MIRGAVSAFGYLKITKFSVYLLNILNVSHILENKTVKLIKVAGIISQNFY